MPVVPAVAPNPLVPNPVPVPVVLAGVPPNEKPPVLQYVKNENFRNLIHTGELHNIGNLLILVGKHLLTVRH